MKYSNDCRRLAQLLMTYRNSTVMLDTSAIDRLKAYKDLLIDLYPYDEQIKDKIIELLKYQYQWEAIPILSNWSRPSFPVTSGMLTLKGVKQGPNYKLILNELFHVWKCSHYQATESQLLNESLPIILNNPNILTERTPSVYPPAFVLVKKRKRKDTTI
jgi:hypothetical protein